MIKQFLMKYFYIFFIIITTNFITAQNEGHLKFDSSTQDYGSLNYDEYAQCDFEFINTGKTTVQIKSIKSNTRDLEFILKDSLIKPGAKSKFSVIYNTEKPGPIRKTITVFTDATPSVYTLTVKGKVLPKK